MALAAQRISGSAMRTVPARPTTDHGTSPVTFAATSFCKVSLRIRRLQIGESVSATTLFRCHSDAPCLYSPMTTASKLMAAVAVSISMAAAIQANAGEPVWMGYRHAPPRYAPQPDLAAAIGGALAGAALELIPRAMAALAAKLPSEASAPPPPPPPVVVAQSGRSPPRNDVLDDIEGNSRGITRQEVEAALIDWCATHADAPLCVKLQVAPPPPSPPAPGPRYAPAPPPYYRGYSAPFVRYYRPGRFRTWNGCQDGWTVQDGLCKPYRGY
jgi:hypothetical protein